MVVEKLYLIISAIIVLIAAITVIFTIYGESSTSKELISIHIPLPDSPQRAPLFKVSLQPADFSYYSSGNLEQLRPNIPSKKDAPDIAQKLLENYGGLPPDAVISLVDEEYLVEKNGTTGKEIARYPVSTHVQYARKIDNIYPVIGDGGLINIELGNDGELLYLNKVWRTVNRSGFVNIIPVKTAVEKLNRGEILGNIPRCSCQLNVNRIYLGYFESSENVTQEYLVPVWIFSGNLTTGDPWHYSVSAWQFADFSTEQPKNFGISTFKFIDKSQTKPSKWKWEFGDRTESTEQNPVHTYNASGMYNVTLTAWNDYGSDTITKSFFIEEKL